MNICEITGLEKTIPIKYFLGDKFLGLGMVSEFSQNESRISEAKRLGIDYYDRFQFYHLRLDTADIKSCYDGKLEQQNDFKKFDTNCCEHLMNDKGEVVNNPNYKPCQ